MPIMKMKKKMPMMSDSEEDDAAPMPSKGAPSLAIALSVQKNNKKKKMASGGLVNGAQSTGEPGVPSRKPDNSAILKENYDNDKWTGGSDPEDSSSTSMGIPKSEYDADKWAEGGMIDADSSHAEKAAFHQAQADKYQRMAEGGEVSDNADESGQTPYAKMNGDTFDNGSYDPDQLDSQPTDSNLMGDEREMDSENESDSSMAAKIRKSLRIKRGY